MAEPQETQKAPAPLNKELNKPNPTAEALRKAQAQMERTALKPAPTPLAAFTDKRLEEHGTPEKINTYKEALKSASIKDIRFNRQFLNGHTTENFNKFENSKKVIKTKVETAKRLAAYTTKQGESYVINYSAVGGHEQLMGLGLGDLLLDEDITDIEVSQNGRTFRAKRGFANGRPCFQEIDDQGNVVDNYVATLDGDSFRILSKNETNQANEEAQKAYVSKLETTNKNLQTHKKDIETNGLRLGSNYHHGSVDIQAKEIANAKTIPDQRIENKLDGYGHNGKDIVAYGKKISQEFNIPWPVIKYICQYESGWNPQNKYKGPKSSNATGLGQFMGNTWKNEEKQTGFVYAAKQAGFKEKYGEKWGDDWETLDGRINPYANLFATIWLTNETYKSLNLRSKPISQQAALAYIAHHEGVGGVKSYTQFLDIMKNEGHQSKAAMINAYNQNPDKYNSQVNFTKGQRSRIAKYGIQDFLKIYFDFAKPIGAASAAEDPETLKKAQEESKTQFDLPPSISTNTLQNGQDTWIFGSSIANGINNVLNYNRTGALGVGGYNALNYRWVIEKNIAALKKLTPPKNIVILGLVHNGLAGPRSVNKSIELHMKLVDLLKQTFPNTKIKIAEAHLYKKSRDQKLIQFNQAIRTKYPKLYTKGLSQGSKLHPPRQEYQQMRDNILEDLKKQEQQS